MANDNDEPPGTETPPWLQPVEEPVEDTIDGLGLASRVLKAGIAVSVLILFGGLVWFLYDQGDTGGPPVLVRAPDGPVKIEPDDRGGMDVPHRDKLVFNRVSGDRTTADEALRPAAEEPLARPEVPSLDVELDAEITGDAVVGAIPATQAPAPDSTDNKPLPTGAPSDVVKNPKSDTKGILSALPKDRWGIQIAAFRNKTDASSWMNDTVKQHEAVFRSLTMALVETHKDMATYYRVRFGSFPDRASALAKCEEIKKLDLSCIVVAPE